MIQYQIGITDAAAHLFEVEIQLAHASKGQRFSLPSWIPGSYMVRDFCKNLINVHAMQSGEPVALTQLDKQTWELDSDCEQLSVRYQVYAWDLSVRSAHLDQTHGFFNGTSTFLKVEGRESEPVSLAIKAPEGSLSHWRVATGLTPINGTERYQFGDYEAEDYDALIDHPVEMGDFTLASFEAGGVQHDLVLTGKQMADTDRICADLKKICQTEIDFFGGQAPYDYYLFLTMVVGDGFGGLEHRNSTALMCGRGDLPSKTETDVTDGYRTFLTLCTHEYFHNWNVKRIKPQRFVPYELSAESYTTQLWAYEGITSYYDDLLTFRSGCIDRDSYLDLLSQTFTRVLRGQGRFKQSLAKSSFNTWTTFYQQGENAQDAIVSYYTKGALFALMLDLTLRTETQGKANLDQLMTVLWEQFGSKGIGTLDNTHQQIVESLLGRDATELFAWLTKTDDLPLPELLEKVGVKLTMRSASDNGDKGGIGKGAKVELGALYKADDFGVRLASVRQGGAAHQAGMSAGDRLIAIDGLQVSANLDKQLSRYEPGSTLCCHWFRRDELMSGEITLEPAVITTAQLEIFDENLVKLWL